MPKVHPNAAAATAAAAAALAGHKLVEREPAPDRHVQVLTVWNKSLLFNGKGFTVFDAKGNLVFRVDNYASVSKADILLMDATGTPLLTIRRKRLSLGDVWTVFEGEETFNPRFIVKKNVNIMNSKSLAHVIEGRGCNNSKSNNGKKSAMYEIEGSYTQRRCAVYDENRCCVAEIRRKEAVGGVSLGVDVFRLEVQPEIDPTDAMALVILLEQMFGSR